MSIPIFKGADLEGITKGILKGLSEIGDKVILRAVDIESTVLILEI